MTSQVLGPDGRFSVCVYCGSRNGVRPAYRALALRLGTAIGRRNFGKPRAGRGQKARDECHVKEPHSAVACSAKFFLF